MGLGIKTTTVKCHSRHITSGVRPVDGAVTADANLHRLAEVVLGKFSRCLVTPLPFASCDLWEKQRGSGVASVDWEKLAHF